MILWVLHVSAIGTVQLIKINDTKTLWIVLINSSLTILAVSKSNNRMKYIAKVKKDRLKYMVYVHKQTRVENICRLSGLIAELCIFALKLFVHMFSITLV